MHTHVKARFVVTTDRHEFLLFITKKLAVIKHFPHIVIVGANPLWRSHDCVAETQTSHFPFTCGQQAHMKWTEVAMQPLLGDAWCISSIIVPMPIPPALSNQFYASKSKRRLVWQRLAPQIRLWKRKTFDRRVPADWKRPQLIFFVQLLCWRWLYCVICVSSVNFDLAF